MNTQTDATRYMYIYIISVAKSENENAIAIKDRPGDVDWIIDEIVKMWTNQRKAVFLCIRFGKALQASDEKKNLN